MNDFEKIARFYDSFAKLKRNREAVPLEQLKTTYGKQYSALTIEVIALADWYAIESIQSLIGCLPMDPSDTEGNKRMGNRIRDIIKEYFQPGNMADRWRDALIKDLDMDAFEQRVFEAYLRCEQEAFDPYWQRHNRWEGGPEHRMIYNDIIEKYWWPPDKTWPNGIWFDGKTGDIYTSNYPPAIAEA